MVLYNNKSEFIGIGKDDLNFLGYDDIHEFKTFVNDFADLFIEKSGYVHKFDNFSWIDYVLHSGACNKNAIIRLKNGKEIETGIKIREIMLITASSDDDIYYGVELKKGSEVACDEKIKAPIHNSIKKSIEEPLENKTVKSFENIEEKVTPQSEQSTIEIKKVDEVLEIKEEPAGLENNENTSISIKKPADLKEDNLLPKSSMGDNVLDDLDKEVQNAEDDFKIALSDDFTISEKDSKEEEDALAEDVQREEDVKLSLKDDSKEEIENIPLNLAQEQDNEEKFLDSLALPKEEVDETEGLNTKKVSEELGIDEVEANKFLNEFLIYVEAVNARLENHMIKGEQKEFKDIIYSIKGLASILKLDKLEAALNGLLETNSPDWSFMVYKKEIENIKRNKV